MMRVLPPSLQDKEAQLARVFLLMQAYPDWLRLPHAYLDKVVYEAIRQNNIRMYVDEHDVLVGYVVWAFLDSSTVARLGAQRHAFPTPPEWNEGESLWLVDLLAAPRMARAIWRDVRASIAGGATEVGFFRRRDAHMQRRRLRRMPWP